MSFVRDCSLLEMSLLVLGEHRMRRILKAIVHLAVAGRYGYRTSSFVNPFELDSAAPKSPLNHED